MVRCRICQADKGMGKVAVAPAIALSRIAITLRFIVTAYA